MADRYTVTYTIGRERIESIRARDEHEAFIMLRNIEEEFGGTTIACEKDIPPRKKKRINSDRRKK